jgi:DNA-binding transcriptional LysR family regulator
MDKLSAMNAFAKVVATRSFAEAGRRLGVTRSAISKAVMDLERSLGARLLDRTTRRVSPTEAGLAYYERCVAILAQVEETEMQISRLHDEPRGVLKINAPMSFGLLYLAEAVADFMALHGDLHVELTLDDRFIDPLAEGVDVTLRIGTLTDSSLIARRLAASRRVVVASPDYIGRHGKPESVADLSRHRCFSYGHATVLQRWQLTEAGKPISVPIAAALSSNNGDVLRAAALRGNGLTVLPTFMVGPDIKDGRLVVVLPNNQPTELGIYALYAPNRYLAAKTRVFIDFLVERFGPEPDWDDFLAR